MILQLQETDKKVVTSPQDIAEILQRLLRLEDNIDQDKEHFYCIHLDTRSRIKLIEVVSIGIVNASLVHPREIFRRAILAGATSILIAHNHPSQNADPSDADLEITKKLQKAGDIIGIPLLDHVIFTLNHYSSFKERSFM
jgi:DNA repair protein RadC